MELFDYQKAAKEECYHIDKEIFMVMKKISYLNKRVARLKTLQNLLQANHGEEAKRVTAVQMDMLVG